MADATALERAHLVIRGVRAELILAEGRITLNKDGPPPTSITFTVDQVRGTVIEPGPRGGRGWIHLGVVGGSSVPPGELAAMSDPYTLPLTSRAAVTARRLSRLVEKHLHERGLPSEPAFVAAASASGRVSSGVAVTRLPERALAGVDGATAAGGSSAGLGQTLDLRSEIDDAYRRTEPSSPPPASEPSPPPRASEPPSIPSRATSAAASSSSVPSPSPSPVLTPSRASSAVPTPSPVPTSPPPPSPPGPSIERSRELVAELRQLGELHASGVLTDAEFEQAKAQVLG